MWWQKHVALSGTREVRTGVLVGKPKERDHLEDLNIDGRIILKCIFKKWDGEAWTRLL
jgi:hypothetical protein